MLPGGSPTWSLIINIWAICIIAYMLARHKMMLPAAAGLLPILLYGENGIVAGLILVWLTGFIVGLLDAVEN